MKKLLFSLMCLCSLGAHADEGMWTLYNLPTAVYDQMKQYGFQLPQEQLYQSDNAVKNAVINFGGYCSGVVVSPDGLVFTNHHCGFECIRRHSTVEHDYMLNGFVAKSYNEELPNEDLFVSFMVEQKDVTDSLKALGIDTLSLENTEAFVDSIQNVWQKAIRQQDSTLRVEVLPFYEGNKYYMTTYRDFEDVRLVFAVPKSMGKFGGETDNWMWPRHTCDFSMFRVYTDRDGNPASYSKDNIPLRPKRFLSISLKGIEEGDFAMVMGYPGRTQRFQTAAQLEQMMQVQEVRIAARTARQEVMRKGMLSNDTVNLQYANKYASSSNGWKKWRGMKECFANLQVIERQRQKEDRFREWALANPKRAQKYGNVIDVIEENVKLNTEYNVRNAVYSESLGNIELLRIAQMNSTDRAAFFKNYNPALDRDITKAMVKFYNQNASPKDSLDLSLLNVDNLFIYSAYTSPERLESFSGQDLSMDPATGLNDQLRHTRALINQSYSYDAAALRDSASAVFTAGLMEWNKGSKSYPDANSTCRLTYGTVQGYTTKDGKKYDYYTNMKGVIDKEAPGNYDFRVPERLKELYKNGDFGQYAGPDGQVPACFITNLDITGGNSGSPVMDAQGNLIGLAFDGNWEAMSGDVIFEPDLQRTICVDIRYVLWFMDKFGGAGYLLDEMDIVR